VVSERFTKGWLADCASVYVVSNHAADDRASNSEAICWFVASTTDETTFDRNTPANRAGKIIHKTARGTFSIGSIDDEDGAVRCQ
jgi:hypothetical protein